MRTMACFIHHKFPVRPFVLAVPHMPNITVTVSVNGILKLLSDLNPHKAAGPDQLKPLVLQRLREVIAPVLQVIYQKSLDTGRMPKDWSTAYTVCPLFKKGDTSLASNYRPISLTSILCKVLEHIVTTNVVSQWTSTICCTTCNMV